MSDKPAARSEPAKVRRPPKKIDDDERAAVLAYAKLHGAAKAGQKFNLSARAIERWRQEIRDGKAPNLARLVAEYEKLAKARNADLIAETVDDLLQELRGRRAKLTNSELIEAVEKVGGLRLSRDMLVDETNAADVAGARTGKPNPGDEKDARPASRGTSSEAGSADTGRDAVH